MLRLLLSGSGVLAGSLFSMVLQAATVIDIEAPGLATRLMMDGRFARVDNAADGSYLLHDRRNDSSFLVLPGTQQVMKLEHDASIEDDGIRLVHKPGPESRIFGYPVQRYQLYTKGDYCGEVFASKQAMEHLDVEPMIEAVAKLIDQNMDAMGPYIAVIDDCTQASMRVLEHGDEIGMPLRVHDANGALLSDIINIDVDADIDTGLLSYPAEYTLVDSVKELSPTQQALKSARQYSPELDKAVRAVENFISPQRQRAERAPAQPYPPRQQRPAPYPYYR